MESIDKLRQRFVSILRRPTRPTSPAELAELATLPRPSEIVGTSDATVTKLNALGQRVGEFVGPLTAPGVPASAVNRVRSVATTTGNAARVEATGDDASVSLVLRPQGPAGSVQIQTPSGDSIATFNQTDIGFSFPVSTQGDLTAMVQDAANTSPSVCLNLSHTLSSGVAGAGMGARARFAMDNSAGNLLGAGYLDAVWTSAAEGLETSAFVFSTRTLGALPSETLRLVAGGSLQITGALPEIRALTPATSISIVPGLGGSIVLGGDVVLSGATPSISASGAGENLSLTPGAGGTIDLGANVRLTGATPTITAAGADQGVAVVPNGTGNIELRGSSGNPVVTVDRDGGADRLGFFGVGPTAQGGAIADVAPATVAAGADTISLAALQADLGDLRTRVNAIIAALETKGLIAS